MKHTYVYLKKELLKNHCPECFSTEGLELAFKQKHTETRFYKAITNAVVCELNCNVCNTAIFPVRWTNDIERVVDYKKKAFTPEPKSFKLKRITWIVLITLDVLIVLAILLATRVIKF